MTSGTRRRAHLVVLSGGLDSTVCAGLAAADAGVAPLTVTFDYGQRHRHEIDRAAAVAGWYGAENLVVPVDASRWGGSALTDPEAPLPAGDGDGGGIPATYVPARNIIFLAIALGIAEARDLAAVYIGVNAVDYSGYPDCRPEFIEAFRQVARVGQKRAVEGDPVDVRAPLLHLSKADIVRTGTQLGAPLHLTWSCYAGGPHPCGACEACRLRAAGFAAAGVPDPALGS